MTSNNMRIYILHRFKNNGIVSHTKVIVGTPDLHFILNIAGMRNRELSGKAIDVIKVAIGLVLMLLFEFSLVERVIVKAGIFGLDSCFVCDDGLFLVVERTASVCGLLCLPGCGG